MDRAVSFSVGAIVLAVLACLPRTSLSQAITIHEGGWTLTDAIVFNNPVAARINPRDDLIYVGRRGTGVGSDGVYRINANSSVT